MSVTGVLLIFSSLSALQIQFLEASYVCGIRKHSFVQLVHHGYKVEDGQWPWHVALFHKMANGSREYACGGTLINEKHILTAAHCVVNRDTLYPKPASSIELHFGQQNLSKIADHTQIRDVSKVHIHPDFSTHRNDIAVVVTRLTVEYTDLVIPICMNQRADRDLRNLEGQRGWITGWGTTQSGATSDVLRTASMPVVSYLQCFNVDQVLFGNLLNTNVFCAGDRNGTSPGTGDSGGGMYFSEGDRWVLRGIISFAKADELRAEVDTSKFTVFVNVQQYLTWVREVTQEAKSGAARGPKRISERECDRFKRLATKRANGLCSNSRYPHTVSIVGSKGELACSGVLVNENHVLTTCQCVRLGVWKPVKVRIDAYREMRIENVTCHPQNMGMEEHHDLAVIKFNSSLELDNKLIPACLASNSTENLYDMLLQTGFEHEDPYSGYPSFIETDENKVITNDECNNRLFINYYSQLAGIIPSQLCVINNDRLRTNSKGSGGGPLQSVNSRTCMYTTVGLTSYGARLKSDKQGKNYIDIDVYTRVSHYLDWIEEIVWNVNPSTTTTSHPTSINTDFVFPDD